MPNVQAARTQLAILFFTTLNLAVFTAAVYVVMLSPALSTRAGLWLFAIMAVSVLVTAPLCWILAPRVRPHWRKKLLAERSPLAQEPGQPTL